MTHFALGCFFIFLFDIIISRLNNNGMILCHSLFLCLSNNLLTLLPTHLTLFLSSFSHPCFSDLSQSFISLLPCLFPTLDLSSSTLHIPVVFSQPPIPRCLVQYIIHSSSLLKTKPCPYFSPLTVISPVALFHSLSPPGSLFGSGGGSGVPAAPSGRNGEAPHF